MYHASVSDELFSLDKDRRGGGGGERSGRDIPIGCGSPSDGYLPVDTPVSVVSFMNTSEPAMAPYSSPPGA